MKTKLNMKTLIGNLLFLAVLLLITARVLSVWSGTAFPLSLISANSMRPTLFEGDVVAWMPADIEEVEVGDVIVYKSWLSWPEERFVAHRVIRVTTAWGEPALITKGDASEWTDQAGPHIVEPPIIEKNFIGKVLSIGKYPLRIPFVGILGIWINDAFNSLSQPTASKGSLAYVGVFAPLTVSVLILIISFFVLPEKTKTAKEKIRRCIFGSRKIQVKQIFLLFLIGYMILLSTIHLSAHDSISASFAVNEFPDKSPFELGSASQGSATTPRNLPVVNPGIFPVKGIIFGSGALAPFVDETTFELESGEYKDASVTASASNTTKNGTYASSIMIYSSPLWFMFPDELMLGIYALTGEGVVICLDLLSAFILTTVTVSFMVLFDYVEKKYNLLRIDFSWRHAPKLYLKKGIIQRMSTGKEKIKHVLAIKTGRITKIDLAEIDPKKPILASLVIIPLLLLISSELLATVMASIIAALAAYFISCKLRKKIILASVLTLSMGIIYLTIKMNLYLITGNYTILESISLGAGIIGVYLFVLGLLLIPLSLISWYMTRLIRNLKERKDPLLILEGRCDL